MEKEKPAFLYELKKRPLEKPLTLNELSALREISHKFLKEDQNALDLLIQYCKHPKFQIRMCEKAYLILTINPLMQIDNTPETIKYGAWALSLLSENQETHKKIVNSGALPTLSNLITTQIHYEINKYCIITIANLATSGENYKKLMELECRDFIILKFLDSCDNHVQYYILKYILGLCQSPETQSQDSKTQNIRKFLIMTSYLEPILRCAVSPDIKVANITLEIINCLITSEKNQGKLMSFNLTGKLYHLYHSIKTSGIENISIMNAIAKIFRALLKYQVNQIRLARDRYIRLLLDCLGHADFDLPLNSAICLSHMSEKIESHEKLVECGVLDLMVTILKETKHPKLYRQACRFMANLSWNAKYQQILLDKDVIDFLLGSLGSVDKWTLTHSVTTIANLSCKSNFHENTKHKNIKYLIHVLDSNVELDDKVLETAAIALANFSADFYYHENLLKEPEITMILKILNNAKEDQEGNVIEHILALVTNLTTNPVNAHKLYQKHVFDSLIKILELSKNYLMGFIAKAISGLSILSKVRQQIIDHKLIYHLINAIYVVDADVQQQILVSLLTLLANSDDFHEIFLHERGLAVLEHFVKKNDHFFIYVACKMLAILSRSKENLIYLLKEELIESIFQCGFSKNYMILKESLRFFTQCMINKKCQLENDFISRICKLAYEGLQFMQDSETVDLSLLSLSIMSQNDSNIPEIAKHIEIFKYLADKSPSELNKHAEMLIMLIMNLSMSPDNHHMLVKFKFINLFNEMIESVDEICHSHILTILIQIFKNEFTEEIFGQQAHKIIIKLLEKDYPHFKSDIIKLINTILEGSITYPEELLEVIHYLSHCPDEEEFTQKDNELLITQTNVLAKFSFNDISMRYFRRSEVIKLMYKILGQEKPEKVIILNCIIILSNISQDPEILNEILKHKVEDILKLSNLKLPFNLKKPFIRILTFMTISTSFNPKLIPNSAINLLFDIVRTYKTDSEGILVPCIICLINLTTMGYDVIYSFSKKGLIHLLYEIIRDQDLDANVISSAIIIVANMMITKQIYDENKAIIDEIVDFANNLLPSASSTHPLILSNILKFIHNLIIIDTSILSSEIADSIISKSINIFIGIADSGTRSVILSILNFMIERNDTYKILIQNQKFLESVLTISFEEKSSFASYDLRTGALALLSIISQHTEGIDFIKKNLNYKEFMDNLIDIYQDNSSDQAKEYMLLILANLCYEKILIKSILTKQDHFNFLYNCFVTLFSTKYDALLETTFKLAINLSADSTINHFLAKEKLLKILNQIFFQPPTTKHIKELIQIFLSNLSFNQANHPDMIKNDCIKIFEQYDALNIKKELDKYALTSLANLALNSNNFYLLENELNMINTLSLIDDFDKPIQIKLLNSAIEYVTDEERKTSKDPPESKKALFIEIFASINSMLETKSLFLIKYCTDMLYRISKTTLGLNVQYDSQALLDNLVEIILKINKKDLKYSNFHNMCLVSKSTLFFENITNTQTLQKLFDHSAKAFKVLREAKEEVSNHLEFEYDIIFFLKFLSNCAIYGKKNKALGIFLINKDLEDFLFNIMIFSNKHSANLLSNIMCCYANMFHSENVSKFYNYGRIFDHLHHNFKKFVKNSAKIENFILGLISLILKGKNYSLSDFSKLRASHGDPEVYDQSFISNFSKKSSFKTGGANLFKYPTNETDNDRESLENDSKSNVNDSLYRTDIFPNDVPKERKTIHHSIGQQVFKSYSLRGNEEHDVRGKVKLDKDLQFIFKFLFYIIKKHLPHGNNSKMMSPTQTNIGGELTIPNSTSKSPLISANRLSVINQSLILNEGPNGTGNEASSTECETFQLLSNLACNMENHKMLLSSKLTEHLSKYLKNEQNMPHEAYKYALTCTLNLGMNKEFYKKIRSHELIIVLMKLYQNNKSLFTENSAIFLLLMVENDTSDDFYNSMDDFINIVNSNIKNLDKETPNYKTNLTKILSLLENTIKIARLKYKIAKISLIFETIFNIISNNDQTDFESFKETNSFMAILTLFADSKECMSYLIKYGIYEIIKTNLQYINQADYLDLKAIKNSIPTTKEVAKPNEVALTKFLERLKFLTNLMNLLDACLELENNSTSASKLKLKVVKDKRIPNNINSDEITITFANIYDSMDMAVLTSEFIENNANLILLTETCLHMTNILLKLRSSNFESIIKILTMITKISKKKKIPSDGESVNQFDNIINALYQIQEKCYTLYEFEIGDIVKIILNIYNSKDTNFLRRSSYLCFNKILVKLDFRKLNYSLDSDIKEIMTMLILNNTEFNDVIYQYYATLIIRKIVVLYEIQPNSQIFEELLEFCDMIIDSIKKFSNSLSSNLSKIEENTHHLRMDFSKRKTFAVAVDKNKKDIEKLYVVLVLETIIILYKFKDLHRKFMEAEVLKSIVRCAQKISEINSLMDNKDNSELKSTFNFTHEDLIYIIRVVSLILYEASYFSDTYEDLLSKPVVQFMVSNLTNPLKSIHTSIYNTLTNVFAIGNSTLIPMVLDEINSFIEEFNTKAIHETREDCSNLIPVIGILDFFYDKIVKEIGKDHQFAVDELTNIAVLLTNLYSEKSHLEMPKGVMGKLLEQSEKHLYVRARTFMLIVRQTRTDKFDFAAENQRDGILSLIIQMIKKELSAVVVKQPDDLSEVAKFAHQEFMANVLEKGIKFFEEAISLENIFYWEYYSEDLKDDDLNIICIVLIMNLLGEISQFQFFSTYLSEIYLVLDNINSRLNTMKVKSPIQEYYEKFLKEILDNFGKNSQIRKV